MSVGSGNGNGNGKNGAHHDGVNGKKPPLSPAQVFRGKKLVIIGGTGFLGKVFWSLLLSRYPMVSRIYLLVRPKKGQTAEERFLSEIATSEVMRPLRDEYGPGYDLFMKDKIVPVPGDVAQPFCGLTADLRDELRGEIDAVVNASGVIDFDPPLDLALEVNAFGVQNLVALARDLGNVRLLHTSTCFVAGEREGFIEEGDPRTHPFPRSGDLERAHWDPDREITECQDVIEQARHRANDAFRQSRFLDEAKRNLAKRDEPSSGKALEGELEKVRRKYIEARLAEMGTERAQFWGWPNTYTYTKSIGEQIVANSGLMFSIVRPAVVESSVAFPVKGWNEGINTSAPLLYSVVNGQTQIPGSDHYLDVIPRDMVAGGMVLSLAELLEGTAPAVYQYGASDVNPCRMSRFAELCGLYKRKQWQRTGKGGPIVSFLQAHVDSAVLDEHASEHYGPELIARGASRVSKFLNLASIGAAKPLIGPAVKALDGFADQQRKIKNVLDNFVPFVARFDYVFRCNTRAAVARLSAEDRRKIDWTPEAIDWREWFLDVHMPGLEKWVFPEIDKRIRRDVRAPIRHETLVTLLDEMAERYDLATALERTEPNGLSRISFKQWRERSRACAARLVAAGVKKGDRVMLAGANHPARPIAFLGIQLAGATAVPVDAAIEKIPAANVLRVSHAKVFVRDRAVRDAVGEALGDGVKWLDLQESAEAGDPFSPVAVNPSDVAALIYTSGTTGTPKGVMLSHYNLTSLVASLAPLFPLGKDDRVLSVLPLHHTFELTCGLLLPLSRGSRVLYLDELTGERLEHGLKAGRITAMVGVPALWEMLERKLVAKVAERGALASRFFDVAIELNRAIGKSTGLDAGKLLFGPVHEGLGGHLRYLVSGGAALPADTQQLFAGLGLHLTEGYGLTEASPVLAVAAAGPGMRAGSVGRAIPGVELKIFEPNADGVGEILARGPNVMVGYADNEEETRRTIDDQGWLHTGDLGKLDRKGSLSIVGRAKDTIVASNGENVYPDDVEARLGQIADIEEYVVLGVVDPRGGERIACVAVPSPNDSIARAERHAKSKSALDKSLAELPNSMRPAVTLLIDVPLPRTATRKVKRAEVRRLVERVTTPIPRETGVEAQSPESKAGGVQRMVRAAIAVIGRRAPSDITGGMTLRGDLGFDSLMLLELLVALENQVQDAVDADRLSAAETVLDVEALVSDTGAARRLARAQKTVEQTDDKPLELPLPLRRAAMHWLGRTQMGFYRNVMRTVVTGRAFIPQNRNTLVAANHSSHLDMGLVKYALGEYGHGMISLAAQDYFFEGGKWRKAYFENLTNLVPLSRTGSLRQSLRRAGSLLDDGEVVLIFPEGTRTPDGSVQEFRPAVGHLALQHKIDILPVWIGGTHAALPKGATVIRSRALTVRIGPPLEFAELTRLTAGMGMSDASRAIARLARRAVTLLARGSVLETQKLVQEDLLEPEENESMTDLFRELEHRFLAGSVKDPISFYFALGKRERWTVNVSSDACKVVHGKVEGSADCVLKTSPAMFTRIVREAYTPTPGEFMSGTVKSNNIALLMTFQKVFQLDSEGRE